MNGKSSFDQAAARLHRTVTRQRVRRQAEGYIHAGNYATTVDGVISAVEAACRRLNVTLSTVDHLDVVEELAAAYIKDAA